MIKISGKTLIQRQLEIFYTLGIKETALVRGYMPKSFPFAVRYFENKDWYKTNMVRSLMAADEWLKSDTCIVNYSDIIYEKKLIQSILIAEGDISITYDINWLKLWQYRFYDPLSDAETFKTDENGKLVEIGNRAETVEEIQGQYMGVLKCTVQGWEMVRSCLLQLSKSTLDKMDMTSLLNILIQKNINIRTVPYDKLWCEIDSEKDLRLAENIFTKRSEAIINE
ncbi:MAG: phosphocholine cytidylyltransferase family protein [Thermodesulfobacteriota bacterium]|nr:phosphocholine cytidylyltransferase family protein [Thermodesulfobacteriota bacterium]